MSDMSLRDIVFNNLTSAKENGFFEPGERCHEMNAQDLAEDLILYAQDCEEYVEEQLVPYVEEWLKVKK